MIKKRIRNISAWFVALLLIGFGFTRRVKKKALNGEFILSIYFHSPDKKLFEFCVKWLIKNNFHFLSQEDVLSIIKENKPLPKGAVIITLDDGWQTNEDNVVAIANKYKIPVTIFISTDPVENGGYWWPYVKTANERNLTEYSVEYLKKIPNKERERIIGEIKKTIQADRVAMTIDQVKSISKSGFITLGSHTVSHPILINCEDGESFFELKESKQILKTWINKNVNTFAYPNGDYSDREIKYLEELGYQLAYTTVPTYLTKDLLQNVYELPRFAIFENISNPEAVCRMLGVWQNALKKT
jgi:peptidoglycan/xylan/chitin deacetylase (PgdA/CDA1 family)